MKRGQGDGGKKNGGEGREGGEGGMGKGCLLLNGGLVTPLVIITMHVTGCCSCLNNYKVTNVYSSGRVVKLVM